MITELQEKSGITDDEMSKVIKNYAESTEEGQPTIQRAARGAAQTSHEQHLGIVLHALSTDPKAKAAFIKETTSRANEVAKKLEGNHELQKILKPHNNSKQ